MTHGNALAVPEAAPLPAAADLDHTLSLVREDVRQGYALIATFKGPTGTSWMEIRGPRGMRPEGDRFLASDVPTLRLWLPDKHREPVVVAAANRAFDAGLRAIEDEARPHLHAPDLAWLAALLRVVREAAPPVRRPRVPRVGAQVTEAGSPSLWGWASCLTLGDLEAALLKSVA